ATIGTDHIDLPWCSARGIAVANAPGCNAPAVAQYVFGAIAALKPDFIGDLTIGIVGVGHVGRIVERWARSLGMRVLRCDPPREHAEGGDGWHTINEIAREADVITIHTPLTTDAPYATRHIINESWLASLVRRPLLINAARGAIIDTPALVSAIDKGLIGRTAIDCWEGEPCISDALLQRADVATPHIAGYSREGKWRASQMILDSLTAFFGLPHIALREQAPAPVPETVAASAIAASYNPLAEDTPALKAAPYAFESLRNGYVLRSELH
ncbi:MAG: 4-phosphoerythronate dehydrogenase, partial [Muribaculaceae bacterium]|nr:4-phosphoerythronate dehydrogenase [Muribaculaceae bacterium]